MRPEGREGASLAVIWEKSHPAGGRAKGGRGAGEEIREVGRFQILLSLVGRCKDREMYSSECSGSPWRVLSKGRT